MRKLGTAGPGFLNEGISSPKTGGAVCWQVSPFTFHPVPPMPISPITVIPEPTNTTVDVGITGQGVRAALIIGVRATAFWLVPVIAGLGLVTEPTLATSVFAQDSVQTDSGISHPSYQIVLLDAGVTPDSQGAIRLLNRLTTSNATVNQIGKYIRDLGSENFHVRRNARFQLLGMGSIANKQLSSAIQSHDFETVLQTKSILRSLKSRSNEAVREEQVLAAFRLLATEVNPACVSSVLAIIPQLKNKVLLKHSAIVLWASVSDEHREQIAFALQHPNEEVRIAAIPAWEIIEGEKAVELVRPLLSDARPAIRLAASRALFDHAPRECMKTLIDLLGSEDRTTKLQAAWLTAEAFDEQHALAGNRTFAQQADLWRKKLLASADQQNQCRLGNARHEIRPFLAGFREGFDRSISALKTHYGDLHYVDSVGDAVASVSKGIARMHGGEKKGEQKLLIKAEQVVGTEQFSNPFTVVAELGGEAMGIGTYHVGITIGNLRILFYPGLRNGGFRIECVDSRVFKVSKRPMPFTPGHEVLCDMRIVVTPLQNGAVRLETTITDPRTPTRPFTNIYVAQEKDIRRLGTIGLERSGGAGGAALFGAFSIEPAVAR